MALTSSLSTLRHGVQLLFLVNLLLSWLDSFVMFSHSKVFFPGVYILLRTVIGVRVADDNLRVSFDHFDSVAYGECLTPDVNLVRGECLLVGYLRHMYCHVHLCLCILI